MLVLSFWHVADTNDQSKPVGFGKDI